MGLDITYYTNVKRVPDERLARAIIDTGSKSRSEAACEFGWAYPYVNDDFPGRADGIADGSAYEYDDSQSFRAGSYTGYNRWRRDLASLVGIDDIESWWRTNPDSGPFVELLHFSDCEGTLGPKVCAKLAEDSKKWAGPAERHKDNSWRSLYRCWHDAFVATAGNGLVEFH